jgi:uncharacterized protein (DUF488 family)
VPAATATSRTGDVTNAEDSRRRVISVGYEGRDINEFVRDLARRGVTVLADVRLNAVSRRHGFSKTALSHALHAAGIEYVHLRSLGNPRENRARFAGDDIARGRDTFRRVLKSDSAQADLDLLRDLASSTVVAVLCVERDEQRCHRRVVIEALASR